MIPWTRRKSADFAEILAELERAEMPDPFAEPEPAPADDRPPTGGAETFPNPADSPSRWGNPLSWALSSFPWRRIRGGQAAASQAAAAYAQEAAERQSPEEPPPQPEPLPEAMPQKQPKSENDVIAEELGLSRRLGKADLLELRRDFAMKNHPDRCAPAHRPRAARRMSIANMLIDAELKRLQRS